MDERSWALKMGDEGDESSQRWWIRLAIRMMDEWSWASKMDEEDDKLGRRWCVSFNNVAWALVAAVRRMMNRWGWWMRRMMDESKVRVWGGWERGKNSVFEKERISVKRQRNKRNIKKKEINIILMRVGIKNNIWI